MNMPAKQEGRVAAKSHSANESLPSWSEEKSNQEGLQLISCGMSRSIRCTYYLESQSQQEACERRDFRKHGERSIAHEPSGNTVERLTVDY